MLIMAVVVFLTRHYLQVFKPVVILDAVDMVDDIASRDRPMSRFTDENVFWAVTMALAGFRRNENVNVAMPINRAAAFPSVVVWAAKLCHPVLLPTGTAFS